MANWIKQGDEYFLMVTIKMNGEDIYPEDCETVEFYTGSLRKTYPEEVTYNEELKCFCVPYTQAETLAFPENDAVAMDVRVKFTSGYVVGAKKMAYITVYDATSEVVL